MRGPEVRSSSAGRTLKAAIPLAPVLAFVLILAAAFSGLTTAVIGPEAVRAQDMTQEPGQEAPPPADIGDVPTPQDLETGLEDMPEEEVRFADTAAVSGSLKYTTFSSDEVEQTVGISLIADYGLSESFRAGLGYDYLPAEITADLDDAENNDNENEEEELREDDLSLHGISARLTYDISEFLRGLGRDEDEEDRDEAGRLRSRQSITGSVGYYTGSVDDGEDSFDLDDEAGVELGFRIMHHIAGDVIIDAEAGYRYLDMDVPAGYDGTDDMDLSGFSVRAGLGYQF